MPNDRVPAKPTPRRFLRFTAALSAAALVVALPVVGLSICVTRGVVSFDHAVVGLLYTIPPVAVCWGLIAAVYAGFRFSLKGLLLFCVVCGFGLAFASSNIRALLDESSATDALAKLSTSQMVGVGDGAPVVPNWISDRLGANTFTEKHAGYVLVGDAHSTKPISPAVMANVARLRWLTRVSLQGEVTDDDLGHLAQLTNLESVFIRSIHVTDSGLAQLAGLRQLKKLTLYDCSVTLDGILELPRIPNLEVLDLGSTLVRPEDVDLIEEHFPGVDVRCDRAVDREIMRAVEEIRKLDGRVEWWGENCPQKAVLTDHFDPSIGRFGQFSDKDLVHIQVLTELRELDMNGSEYVTDDGLRCLAQLPKLEQLSIGSMAIMGPGLEHLRELPNLRALDLSNDPIDDTAIDFILAVPRLDLLESINLKGTAISAEARKRLEQSAPNAEIVW